MDTVSGTLRFTLASDESYNTVLQSIQEAVADLETSVLVSENSTSRIIEVTLTDMEIGSAVFVGS